MINSLVIVVVAILGLTMPVGIVEFMLDGGSSVFLALIVSLVFIYGWSRILRILLIVDDNLRRRKRKEMAIQHMIQQRRGY